jgi:hypothetical protein
VPVRPEPFATPGAAWDDPVVTWDDAAFRWDGHLWGPLTWGGPGPPWGYAFTEDERRASVGQ